MRNGRRAKENWLTGLGLGTRVVWFLSVLLLTLSCFGSVASGQRSFEPPVLHIDRDAGRVSLQVAGRAVLQSPREGLWSIACAWQKGWPADWHDAGVQEVLTTGGWTVLRGTLAACGGQWQLEDAYRLHGSLIEGRRRWRWLGTQTAPHVTLAIRWQSVAGAGEDLLPSIDYSGNPSGVHSGRVSGFAQRAGEDAFFEEHRFPEPFAYKEIGSVGVALHSLPSPTPFAQRNDQWWSLGFHQAEGGVTELALLSGPCASGGLHSVVRAVQGGVLPYDNAYLNVPPMGSVEKTFYLDAYSVAREGSGFERSVWQSIRLFAPYSLEGLPSAAETVRAKYRYALTRWIEKPQPRGSGKGPAIAGFRKYANRDDIVMGWTGEAEGPGYALQVLAPHLPDTADARRKARLSLDFLATATFDEKGFHYWWKASSGQWTKDDLLNQAQAMLGMAHAIEIGRRQSTPTTGWETFLHRAARLHAERILAADWHPEPTTEAYFVAPLLQSATLFREPRLRAAALKAADYFAARHLSMRVPYWGGTSDAECEDKEGAYAAFQAFLYAYTATHSPKYLSWARHAADVVLSYLVVWDIDLPPGRLRDSAFKTRGWTSVSVQNQHLDEFGVLIAADLYHLAQIERDAELQRVALVMFRSCGQLIDVYGSQGEQIQETNYGQRAVAHDLDGLRGGYNAEWTVFWVTAHFLNGAAQLEELGAPIWDDAVTPKHR